MEIFGTKQGAPVCTYAYTYTYVCIADGWREGVEPQGPDGAEQVGGKIAGQWCPKKDINK